MDVRIALDCIKTLTYNCGEQDYKVLEQVNDDLIEADHSYFAKAVARKWRPASSTTAKTQRLGEAEEDEVRNISDPIQEAGRQKEGKLSI